MTRRNRITVTIPPPTEGGFCSAGCPLFVYAPCGHVSAQCAVSLGKYVKGKMGLPPLMKPGPKCPGRRP